MSMAIDKNVNFNEHFNFDKNINFEIPLNMEGVFSFIQKNVLHSCCRLDQSYPLRTNSNNFWQMLQNLPRSKLISLQCCTYSFFPRPSHFPHAFTNAVYQPGSCVWRPMASLAASVSLGGLTFLHSLGEGPDE